MSRISPYQPEYCDQAIAFLGEGFSIMALAGELGVCRATVYNWKRDIPEFAEAIDIGLAKGAARWERRLIKIAEEGGGNPTAAIFGLKNRAAEEWRDRTELTGKDGGPIQTEDLSISDEDLAKRVALMLMRAGGK